MVKVDPFTLPPSVHDHLAYCQCVLCVTLIPDDVNNRRKPKQDTHDSHHAYLTNVSSQRQPPCNKAMMCTVHEGSSLPPNVSVNIWWVFQYKLMTRLCRQRSVEGACALTASYWVEIELQLRCIYMKVWMILEVLTCRKRRWRRSWMLIMWFLIYLRTALSSSSPALSLPLIVQTSTPPPQICIHAFTLAHLSAWQRFQSSLLQLLHQLNRVSRLCVLWLLWEAN